MNKNIKVGIVGAGIQGVSNALFLQKKGFNVTIFDRDNPGSQAASYGNAGHFSPYASLSLNRTDVLADVPSMLLSSTGPLALKWNYVPKMIPWFMKFIMNTTKSKMMHTAKNMHQILDLALPAYDELFDEIDLEGLVENKGILYIWNDQDLKSRELGETLITGIGQGYTQTTPLQLCLMTAQIANGGYSIKPRIIVDNNRMSLEETKRKLKEETLHAQEKKLFNDPRNIKIVQEAMFSSTNELYGTSYKSRIDDPKYQFAGKTGTAQVKRISMRERELDLKIEQIPYKDRDHALYIAYGPYINPRYALSIIVEHGGSGSRTAAPIAKELFKLIIDRNDLRNKQKNFEEIKI